MWIRLDVDIGDNDKIQRARTILGLSTPQMVGHYALLLCKLGQHYPSGNIADLHPSTLEEYVRWTGEAGAFDRVIRDHFTTENPGVLDGWEERQGKLIARQEADRKRKKAAREAAKKLRPQDRPQDIRRTGDGTATVNGNGNGNEYGNEEAAAAGGAAVISLDYLARCVITLNLAQQANPKIGHRANEIPVTSQSGVVEWEQDGIPVDVAVDVIRERASTFTPRPNRKQITSLRYFDAAIRERWATMQASGVTSAAVVPGARDVADAAWAKAQGY